MSATTAAPLARPMNSVSTEYDVLAKAIIVGDSSVGKSSLLYRYTEQDWNPHYIATIGVDFKVMTFERQRQIVKLQLWDTAGQDRFRTIVHTYYRGAHAVLLVFAVDDRQSFENLHEWMGDVQRFATAGVPVVLVGNKCDCRPEDVQVPDDEAEALAERMGAVYAKTSARMNVGVDEAFTTLLERCLEHKLKLVDKQRDARGGHAVPSVRLGGRPVAKPRDDKCAC
jgi:Ras-related protein Rab-8A